MGKYNIDMWYGDKPQDADKITIAFSDCDCEYRGNIYKNDRIIGDYRCNDSATLEKLFPQLVFNWG